MLKELIEIRNNWILLAKHNPQIAPIINKCINDLDVIINKKLIPSSSKIEGQS